MRTSFKCLQSIIILGIVVPGMTTFAGDDIKPFELKSCYQRSITSKAVGDKFKLNIGLPYGYSKNKKYPVIYQLDGGGDNFVSLVSTVHKLTPTGRIPKVIVVGIDYFGKTKRSRDYTPVPSDQWGGAEGKADNFIKFLKTELIPFIDKNYATHPTERILTGHSYGGLCTIYTLTKEPGLFTRYIAISPSAGFVDGYYLKEFAKFAKTDTPVSAVVYAAAGEFDQEGTRKGIGTLKELARQKQGITLLTDQLANEDHTTVHPLGLHIGLLKVMETPRMALPKGVKKFAGSIDLSGKWQLKADPKGLAFKEKWAEKPLTDSVAYQVPGEFDSLVELDSNGQVPEEFGDIKLTEKGKYNGVVVIQKKVKIPANWQGKRIFLNAGRIDDMDVAFINGKKVGQTDKRTNPNDFWRAPRSYKIDNSLIKFGKENTISLIILDNNGSGGILLKPIELACWE